MSRTSILPMQRRCRIALTGGPGGGKTTAADLFRRELGESVVIVPESATILFAGGFPRSHQVDAGRAVQTAIFHVQRNLEDVQSALFPERVLLCDRGTVDGAAYWPNGDRDFFEAMGTSFETELQRYDAVVFFETAAVAGEHPLPIGRDGRGGSFARQALVAGELLAGGHVVQQDLPVQPAGGELEAVLRDGQGQDRGEYGGEYGGQNGEAKAHHISWGTGRNSGRSRAARSDLRMRPCTPLTWSTTWETAKSAAALR